MEELVRSGQDQVRGAEVTGRDRNLELNIPARVSHGQDRLRHGELARVPEPDRGNRVQPPSEFMPSGRSQPATSLKRDSWAPPLRPADPLLGDAGQGSELSLGQPGPDPGHAQLLPVALGQPE